MWHIYLNFKTHRLLLILKGYTNMLHRKVSMGHDLLISFVTAVTKFQSRSNLRRKFILANKLRKTKYGGS